jgi:hypothetical protein
VRASVAFSVLPSHSPSAIFTPSVERVLAGYSRDLFDERALTEHTVLVRYVPTARLFLDDVIADGGGLDRLAAADVSSFLARECRRRTVAGGRELVVALRSFLRICASRA